MEAGGSRWPRVQGRWVKRSGRGVSEGFGVSGGQAGAGGRESQMVGSVKEVEEHAVSRFVVLASNCSARRYGFVVSLTPRY